jgi:hypothetical protein
MLIIDFGGFTARLLYPDKLGGKWVIDITESAVSYELWEDGRVVGAKETPYDQKDPQLQSQFPPIIFWAIRGLHGLPLEYRGRNKSY